MIGLQLYTIREKLDDDFYGSLNKVYEYGYKAVEFAGIYPKNIKELKEKLDEYGIKSLGAHEIWELLKNDLDTVLKRHKELDSEYIVIPFYRPEDKSEYMEFAKKVQKIAKKVEEKGFKLLYHNHSFEFTDKIGDKNVFEFMYENIPNLYFELDTFWVEYANIDSAQFIKEHKDRIEVLHIKDMKEKGKAEFVPAGQGVIDIEKIVKTAKNVGINNFILEIDKCQMDEFECISKSMDYLKKII